MNVTIVKPQPGPQEAFVNCSADVTCYGGSRGGGKSWAIALDFWIHAEKCGADARGLILRKTREDLKDFLDTATNMYGASARYSEKGNFFAFTSGARLYAGYLEREQDAQNYQGWSLTRLYFDELTQLTSLDSVLRLLATLRSAKGIKPLAKFSCNPGGPSHHEVKAKFVDLGAYNVTWKNGLSWVFIPAKVTDNPALLQADPRYIDRLKSSGSPQLVRAWLEGDWDVVEGSFFPEFSRDRHVINPFTVPAGWTKFRSMDWGSASPFCVHWIAVVQDDLEHAGRIIPRSALVVYREWYGASAPNVGLKLTAEEVAAGIIARETDRATGRREDIAYGVLDPSAFAVQSGPSIAETLIYGGAQFRRADNTRTSNISHDRRKGGWDQIRARLKGDAEGRPTIYFFSTCRDIIRTLPLLQHDQHQAEDVDTDGDDHAADSLRYALLSRPYLAHVLSEADHYHEDRNPYLVKNAFGLDLLED